jgi:hypothetical protein
MRFEGIKFSFQLAAGHEEATPIGRGGEVALFKPLDRLGDTASPQFKIERLCSLDAMSQEDKDQSDVQ